VPRKFFRKYLPTAESVRQHRYLGRLGRWLHHPNLWHLNRRSVSGGVAIGMFCGLIPGPFQMLGAALLSIPLRMNLPVALFTTLYTNPFTIGPLYVIAYYLGRLLVRDDVARVTQAPDIDWAHWSASLHAYAAWALSLGKPLAIGLVALALALAALGYLCVQVAWRAYVILAWRRRHAARLSGRTDR
jgi:uncharacterized protein (DUF2062 family)